MEKISDGSITLEKGKGGEVSRPTEVGSGVSHGEKIEHPPGSSTFLMSDSVRTLNQANQLFFESIREDAVSNPGLRQAAIENPKCLDEKDSEMSSGKNFCKKFTTRYGRKLLRSRDIVRWSNIRFKNHISRGATQKHLGPRQEYQVWPT
jgi:hypothetical protein